MDELPPRNIGGNVASCLYRVRSVRFSKHEARYHIPSEWIVVYLIRRTKLAYIFGEMVPAAPILRPSNC